MYDSTSMAKIHSDSLTLVPMITWNLYRSLIFRCLALYMVIDYNTVTVNRWTCICKPPYVPQKRAHALETQNRAQRITVSKLDMDIILHTVNVSNRRLFTTLNHNRPNKYTH